MKCMNFDICRLFYLDNLFGFNLILLVVVLMSMSSVRVPWPLSVVGLLMVVILGGFVNVVFLAVVMAVVISVSFVIMMSPVVMMPPLVMMSSQTIHVQRKDYIIALGAVVVMAVVRIHQLTYNLLRIDGMGNNDWHEGHKEEHKSRSHS